VLFNKKRDAPCFFTLFESLWMLAGRNDVAPLDYYNSQIADIASDDGKTFNGAYGYRWRHSTCCQQEYAVSDGGGLRKGEYVDRDELSECDQLAIIIDQLRRNPESRRCVLQMWNCEDDLLKIDETKDCCCNVCVFFSLRNGEVVNVGGVPVYLDASRAGDIPLVTPPLRYLDMTVVNRSNDMIWGMLGANACLSGSTLISSPEGDVTIKALASKMANQQVTRYPVYSFDPVTKRFGLAWCTKAWKSGRKKTIEIRFDDGSSLRCTRNHKLYKKKWNNNQYCQEVQAGDLKVGDRVWATRVWDGKEGRRFIKKFLNKDTNWNNMSSVAHAYYEFRTEEVLPDGVLIHHKDENKANDRFCNLGKMTRPSHAKHHINGRHPMRSAKARKKASESRKMYFANMSAQERADYAEARSGFVISEATKAKMSKHHKAIWQGLSAEERSSKLKKWQGASIGVPCRRFTGKKHTSDTIRKMAEARRKFWKDKHSQNNHKIISIKEMPTEDVYDFTVDGTHNAMLSNGVLVHNCHFSFLQEYVANCLGVEVGSYNQVSNNLHVYTERWEPEKWLAEYQPIRLCTACHPNPIYIEAESGCCGKCGQVSRFLRSPNVDDYKQARSCLYDRGSVDYISLVQDQARFDKECAAFIDCIDGDFEEPFLRDVAQPMMAAFRRHKRRSYRDNEGALNLIERVKAEDWKIAGRNWLLKRCEGWEKKGMPGYGMQQEMISEGTGEVIPPIQEGE
jgi:thymidylate synthase